VAGCCECGEESSGSCATELVNNYCCVYCKLLCLELGSVSCAFGLHGSTVESCVRSVLSDLNINFEAYGLS
jgi:hypothetical protein